MRSNSCVSVSTSSKFTGNLVSSSSISMRKQKDCMISLTSTNSDTSMNTSVNERRRARISAILDEVKKEKPLGRCPLFKMTLTFRSFVWAPVLDSYYNNQLLTDPRNKELLHSVILDSHRSGRKLARSNSVSSLNSQHISIAKATERQPLESDFSHKVLDDLDLYVINNTWYRKKKFRL